MLKSIDFHLKCSFEDMTVSVHFVANFDQSVCVYPL